MSLEFYLAHPQTVEALVICDSGPGYRNPQARETWNERARGRAVELEARGLEALSGRSREMQEAMGHHASAQGLAHAARGMLAQTDSRVIDGLPSIAVPTLVIVGDKDEPFVVPQTLNVRHGILVAENLRLADAACTGLTEFLLVISHAKLRGATGAWIAPLAIV